MRLALDLMGGDRPPEELFDGVVQSIDDLSQTASFIVIAPQKILDQLPKKVSDRLQFHIADEYISMDDDPLQSAKTKKGSTLIRGIELIKNRQADALVTTGNTGSLIASSALYLSKFPTIDRPALLAVLPREKKPVVVVDVGGNLFCSSNKLVQFALMGAAYQRCVFNNPCPNIGLLNIGQESGKGPRELQETYAKLEKISPELDFSFLGNIEGREVFKGDVDVLVTNGFTGNVFLKTAEGVSQAALQTCRLALRQAGYEFPETVYETLKKQFCDEKHPGALVCGVDGILVKCHGSSTASTIAHSIAATATLVEKNIVEQLKRELFLFSGVRF